MATKIIKGHGLKITLDDSNIVPEDPGSGTPAMVEDKDGNCATFHCAHGEGNLDCEKLTDKQWQFLDDRFKQVENWLDEHNC